MPVKSDTNYLIPTSLCTRCGACYAADSTKVLSKDPKGGFPIVQPNANADEVMRLRKVCTGNNWSYRSLLDYTHGTDYPYDPSSPDKGRLLQLGIAYSRRSELVEHGQSGGVSTSIIAAALHSGLIDSFLAVRRPQGKGRAFSAEPFIVRSLKDLRDAAGSKYTISTSLELLPKLEQESRAYAVSLLPCQTAGFRRLQQEGLVAQDKCRLVMGPFCGFNMEQQMGPEVARRLGIDPDEVVEFGNRKGHFPGETLFRTADGSTRTLDRTAHRALYKIFTPQRCFTCTDFTNELADLSIADCWIPGKPDGYRYPQGAAWVLIRTERGQHFVDNAVNEGWLHFEKTPLDANDTHWEESILQRKVRAFNRIHIYNAEGQPVPKFDHPIPTTNNQFFKLDKGDHSLRKWLARPVIRCRFLDWWIRIHTETRTTFENSAKRYLSNHVFTHRSNADTLWKAIFRLIFLFIKKNRLTRFVLRRKPH